MSPILLLSVKKSPVGLENVMNALAEGVDETRTISFKGHIALYKAIIDLGKILQSHAIGSKLFAVGNQTPDQVTGRDS